jgi:hypothetical protein
VRARLSLRSRALLSSVILVSATRTFVAMFVHICGAPPASVPVVAQCGACWGDKPSFVCLPTSGFGPVPEGLGTTLPGVVGVCGC